MREIKLRGLTRGIKNNYVWVYGFLAPFHNILTIKEKFGASYAIKRESVGEYTGYKDKTGREIYEGDIVETTRALNHIIGEVVLYKGCWYIKDYNGGYYRLIPRFGIAENKVIGNIYENPELLEK